uniref:Reticulon domain-containing protein n=1 Tax=Cannabis sativa TaxID=3483 RepID=A0A803NNM8_CANSA
MSTTGGPKDRDLQLMAAPEKRSLMLPPKPPSASTSSAIVEYTPPVFKEEEEDIEIKLRRIIDNVPVRVSNTSGSSAGSGSGDFHQYRQMRRKEQDRLARMDVDYQRRKEEAEFIMRREERLKAAEERTAKRHSMPPRRISVHQALGGGYVSDVLLWKKWSVGVAVLLSSTALWFLFERAGYNPLSFVANVLLLLVVILFFWAKSASLLNSGFGYGNFFVE